MSAFGIDLGTTVSSIGFTPDGTKVELITDPGSGQSSSWFPTMVQYPDSLEPVFGHYALDDHFSYPTTTFYDLKLLIGRRYSEISSEIQSCEWSFPISAGPDDSIVLTLSLDGNENQFTPRELYSKFLNHLVAQANQRLRPPVYDAVITVPANFPNDQR
jgi:molecular chaperone DnaK (HSP70)